jgi:hypothetical protein
MSQEPNDEYGIEKTAGDKQMTPLVNGIESVDRAVINHRPPTACPVLCPSEKRI